MEADKEPLLGGGVASIKVAPLEGKLGTGGEMGVAIIEFGITVSP